MDFVLNEIKQGSEKQIKFASDIRNKMILDFQKKDLNYYQREIYLDDKEKFEAIYNIIKSILETEDRSCFYIYFKNDSLITIAENILAENKQKEELKDFLTENSFNEKYTQLITVEKYGIKIKYKTLDTNLRVIYSMLIVMILKMTFIICTEDQVI